MSPSDHVSPAEPASQTAQIPKIKSGNSQIIGDTVDRDLEQGSITDPTVHATSQVRRHNGGWNYPWKRRRRELNTVTKLVKSTLTALGGEQVARLVTPPKKVAVLRVIDLSFDGTVEPILRLDAVHQRGVESSLKFLPVQSPGTARIYICGFSTAPLDHLKKMGVENVGVHNKLEVSNFTKLAPQWEEKSRSSWWGMKVPAAEENSVAFIRCVPSGGDKLVVVHSVPESADASWMNKWNDALRDSYLQGKGTTASILKCKDSCRNRMEFSKLVLLNVLDVALAFSSRYFHDLASSIHNEYTTHGYRRLDYAAVEKHNDESSRYETLVDVVQDLIDAVELVISSIIKLQLKSRSSSKHADATDEFPSNVSPTVEDFFESMRTACIQVKKQATRIQAYHERRYNLYISALNIHESHSVRRLTTLATGFLPLSLGASMLSIQTRFADLGLLVYDFVAVGMLLFFLMYTSYILMIVVVRSATWRPFAKALKIMEVSKNRVKELPFWAQDQLSVIVDILPHMTRLLFGYGITLMLVSYMLESSNNISLALKLSRDGIWAGAGFFVVICLVLSWRYVLVLLRWGKK